jgi:AraC-like DNA-binding protein
MDPLSDVLRAVRLDGAYFYPVEATGRWCVEAAPARQLVPRIMPDTEHLISYHLISEGGCWGGLLGEELIALETGDVVLFPHGDAHVMSSSPARLHGVPLHREAAARYPNTFVLGDGTAGNTSLLCGFLGCDLRPFNPLLTALPRQVHIRGMSGSWSGSSTRMLLEEVQHGRAGAEGILTRLAELMFIEVVRRYLEELPNSQTGWLAGLRDEVVGRALTLLHQRPAHPWTLIELAQEVAASRSRLAERFAELVGQPPMQYLAQWRMQLAASQLVQGRKKLAAIASDVGYDSEAAFSRAFKRATGQSPGAWREARAAGAS